MLQRAIARLKHNEAWKKVIYIDTKGNVTIGWGFNLGTILVDGKRINPARLSVVPVQPLPEALGEQWLLSLFGSVVDILSRLEFWDELDDVRREVLVDLTYNMGPKVLGFTHFIAQLAAKDYDTAASNMEGWPWRKDVGERRAAPLIRMMRTGVYEELAG